MKPEETVMQKGLLATLWAAASTYGGRLVGLVSIVVLARLLSQEEFGVAGYGIVAIGFATLLGDLGVGGAIVYYRDHRRFADTAFILNLVVGLGLFATAWIAAPAAALVFNDDRAVPIVRVLALTLPVLAFAGVPRALLVKELRFKRKLVPDFLRDSGRGGTSIIAAFSGAGPWSLIFGQLVGSALFSLACWRCVSWRPSLRFDLSSARALLAYGTKVSIFNVLNGLPPLIAYVFVGRYLGVAALGVYVLSRRVPEFLIAQFFVTVSQVLFPTYAKLQNDDERLRRGFLKTTRYMAAITVPMGVGLALISEPMVLTLFDEKWAAAITVIPAIAIMLMIRSLTFNVDSLYKAKGRPGVLARLAILRLCLMVPASWWASRVVGTLEAVVWVQVPVIAITGLVQLQMATQMLVISWGRLLAVFAPTIGAGAIMTAAVLAVQWATPDLMPAAHLVIAILAGTTTYAAAQYWLQHDVVVDAYGRLKTAVL